MTHKEQGRMVGTKLYPTLSDEHKTVISLGMTPQELITSFQTMSREKLAKDEQEKWLIPDHYFQRLVDGIDQSVIDDMTLGFVLGLMNAATEAGRMKV